MSESPFNRLAGFKICNFLKKRLQDRCFPVNIAKNLRTLQQAFFKGPPLQCLKSSLQDAQWQPPLLFEKKKNLSKQSLVVILCHSLYRSFTIRCHSLYYSLSLVVTRCTTRLSFYKRSNFTDALRTAILQNAERLLLLKYLLKAKIAAPDKFSEASVRKCFSKQAFLNISR